MTTGSRSRYPSKTIGWTFCSPRGLSNGRHALDGRIVRCWDEDGLAWTNTYHTRAEAESHYNGDLRAMAKNGLYVFAP